MERQILKQKLRDGSTLTVVAELTGGPGFNFGPIDGFLKGYGQCDAGAIPSGFEFAAIALPQSPGGVANIEPASVISHVAGEGLLGELAVLPHITCKDTNADAITSSLATLKALAAQAQGGTATQQTAAREALAELDAVLGMDYGVNQYSYGEDLSDDEFNGLRRRLADRIVGVVGVLSGSYQALPSRRSRHRWRGAAWRSGATRCQVRCGADPLRLSHR